MYIIVRCVLCYNRYLCNLNLNVVHNIFAVITDVFAQKAKLFNCIGFCNMKLGKSIKVHTTNVSACFILSEKPFTIDLLDACGAHILFCVAMD